MGGWVLGWFYAQFLYVGVAYVVGKLQRYIGRSNFCILNVKFKLLTA